jgi:hypothetical protein
LLKGKKLIILSLLISSLSLGIFESSVQALEPISNTLTNTTNVTANSSAEQLKVSEIYVREAIKAPSFGAYNIAYAETMKITNTKEREQLLNKLVGISDKIYSPDILYFLKLIMQLSETGSGKIYDKLDTELRSSSLLEIDREYLLGELTSWGKKLVFTPEYSAAVNKIVKAWGNVKDTDKTNLNASVADASNAVSNVANIYSRVYLEEQVQLIKSKSTPTSVITFADKNLEKEVRYAIKKPTGDILKSDAEKVRLVLCGSQNITDLSGIENLINLNTLILAGNQINNIEPLKALTKLTSLDLAKNQISDIAPLRGLSNLTDLSLYDNQISNIEPLKELTNLTALELNNNPITDIAPIKGLSKLTSFSLYAPYLETAIRLYDKADEIIKSIITPEISDLEKVKAVHDYVVLNTKYDFDNYLNGTIPYDSYMAYGVILNGTGVCSGYAAATKLLLNKAGLYCITIGGEADGFGGWEGHEWNIVKIYGEYYHLDVTWDDPAPDTEGFVSYDYFNLSDSEISKDHKWSLSKYPVSID